MELIRTKQRNIFSKRTLWVQQRLSSALVWITPHLLFWAWTRPNLYKQATRQCRYLSGLGLFSPFQKVHILMWEKEGGRCLCSRCRLYWLCTTSWQRLSGWNRPLVFHREVCTFSLDEKPDARDVDPRIIFFKSNLPLLMWMPII